MPTLQHPRQPIQERIERVRIEQKIDHDRERRQDEQKVKTVFGDGAELGHGAEYAARGRGRKPDRKTIPPASTVIIRQAPGVKRPSRARRRCCSKPGLTGINAILSR